MAIEIKQYPECYNQYKFDFIPEVVKAVEKAIEKWDMVCAGCAADLGGENCALCNLFCNECNKGCLWGAVNCPIVNLSDEMDPHHKPFHYGCANTPWERWNAIVVMYPNNCIPGHYNRRNIPFLNNHLGKVFIDELCDEAEKMVEFLIELLPLNHKLRKEI